MAWTHKVLMSPGLEAQRLGVSWLGSTGSWSFLAWKHRVLVCHGLEAQDINAYWLGSTRSGCLLAWKHRVLVPARRGHSYVALMAWCTFPKWVQSDPQEDPCGGTRFLRGTAVKAVRLQSFGTGLRGFGHRAAEGVQREGG